MEFISVSDFQFGFPKQMRKRRLSTFHHPFPNLQQWEWAGPMSFKNKRLFFGDLVIGQLVQFYIKSMSYLLAPCRFTACLPSLTPPLRISNRSAKINSSPLALCLSSRLSSISMSQSTSDSPNDAAKADDSNYDDVLVQYVVLRRDLIDTWPLGSVVTQGCHASVSSIWSHKDDPHTLQYCSPQNINSMHKA